MSTTMVRTLSVLGFRLWRIRLERNAFGPGFWLDVQIGPRGAGYRSVDFPWFRHSIHAPRWRRLPWVAYVPGITLSLSNRARGMSNQGPGYATPRRHFTITTNGNSRRVPAWW